MAKAKIDTTLDEIKKLLKSKSLVIGTDRTIKELRSGKLAKVFISKNTPENIRADLNHYGKLANVKIVNLKYSNEEIGEICKKPFSISVLGQIK